MSLNNNITFFGETTFRNLRKKFGIKTDDRRRHVYMVGKTGMGKTVMLENMAIQDIKRGKGVGFIDPHGEAAEKLLDHIPAERIKDVIYFNPADLDYPIAFNIMEEVPPEQRHLVASGLMGVFKKIWPDVWSARMEYILNNCVLALLEYPGSTLLGINRMFADPDYRKKVVDKVSDPVIKSFWLNEFARYSQSYEVEATAAIQNKIGQFISASLVRNIIGQTESSIDMREAMDKEKILILNLSKGKVGEDNSKLIGALLVTKLQLAAMSRVNIPEEKRKDFYLYVDEFQNFATSSFINILSEARKYRLCLILGHQYISQLAEGVKEAVFGNVGTIVSFRVGADDADYLEKEFHPEFSAADLVNLGKYNTCIKLMIDGVTGRPFSAETLPPTPPLDESSRDKIIKVSREKYSTPRQLVEEKISQWAEIPQSSRGLVTAPPKLHDAQCSFCGKSTKVVFEPDGVRPVYCKNCRKKMEKKGLSLEEAAKKEPLPFAPSRNKKTEKSLRKEVNLNELRKAIDESLESPGTNQTSNIQEEKIKRGLIQPGEAVKFK